MNTDKDRAIINKQTNKTCKNQSSSQPLPGDKAVAKEDDRCKDSEELPCGSDDGAGEGAKVTYAKEDEELEISASADGGPRSRVRARGTLCSAPHRH